MTGRSLSLGAVLLGLSALSQGSAWAQAEDILAYKAVQPAEVKVTGTEHKEGSGVIVEDVTFPSAMGAQPTQAYIVKPDSGSGPWAGVLFVHWFAPPDPTSNRTQYLDEAKELARRGTVSILPSTFWSEEARYSARKWEDDYQRSVDQAKDLRRALDVLLAQPGVDPKRIGVVGHDYGAMFSAVAMTSDTRPKALVFIAGTARFPDWYLFGSASGVPKGKDLDDFRARFTPIDPCHRRRQDQDTDLLPVRRDGRLHTARQLPRALQSRGRPQADRHLPLQARDERGHHPPRPDGVAGRAARIAEVGASPHPAILPPNPGLTPAHAPGSVLAPPPLRTRSSRAFP